VCKILTLFTESLKYMGMKRKGTVDDWSYLYTLFNFLRSIGLFSVIILVGTGWSHLKPFLTDRDKQIILVVLVIQVLVNIAGAVVDYTEPGQAGWVTWRDILHILDMICFCVILLPIVWSIRHLRQASSSDGKAAANASRLQAFRSFYLLVVCFIYFTRIIVYLLGATLPFEYTWIQYFLQEAAAVGFYATTGYLFRPQTRNPYLALDKDDDDYKPSAADDNLRDSVPVTRPSVASPGDDTALEQL